MTDEVGVAHIEVVRQKPKVSRESPGTVKAPLEPEALVIAARIPPYIGEADPKVVDPDAILKSLIMNPEELAKDTLVRAKQATEMPQPEGREKQDVSVALARAERSYIDNHKQGGDLAERYDHASTDATLVGRQVETYAAGAGLSHEQVTEIAGRSFDAETRAIIQERVQAHIDRLLASEKGRINPEKHRLVSEQTQRYLDLIQKAQAEGDMPQSMDAQAVLQFVEQNVWKLAYQDRVASENMLGDHGIRHLVGHNISVTEVLGDELARNGQEVRAVDRLMMHQVMIDHDLGYAMDTVRQPIAEGKFGADAGHNVLAAKVLSQRLTDSSDVINKVFSQDQIATMHKGILYHDAKPSKFTIGDTSPEARQNNIYSAIHTADNTHAFENKLPELLYGYPSSLQTLRLMQAASEIGDTASVDVLKGKLIADIQANQSLTQDDRKALVNAAYSLSGRSYEKTVPRIAGNNPEFSIDSSGTVTVSVRDSEVHRVTAEQFGIDEETQIKKFIGDVAEGAQYTETGAKSADGSVVIELRDITPGGGKSNYQQRVEQLIEDPRFKEFVVGKQGELGDAKLAEQQRQAKSLLKEQQEGTEMQRTVSDKLQTIINQRRERLQNYLQGV